MTNEQKALELCIEYAEEYKKLDSELPSNEYFYIERILDGIVSQINELGLKAQKAGE